MKNKTVLYMYIITILVVITSEIFSQLQSCPVYIYIIIIKEFISLK